VGVLERSAKIFATPVFEFVAHGIGDELAEVLLPSVDVSNQVQ
jgi:hypothetical protein